MIIDSHCHPHFPQLASRSGALVENMRSQGVAAAVAVCTRCEEADELLKLAATHREFLPTLGVHPNADPDCECDPQRLLQMLREHPQFVAVGETGLDYVHETCSRRLQRQRFAAQIEVALAADLPLIVHTRESATDALAQLAPAAGRGLQAVLHCFTGSMAEAKKAWDLGLLVSYTGIATFKNAAEVLAIAAAAPLAQSMIETDAPYLAPEPHRGRINEPAWTRLVGERIAAARRMRPEDYFAAVTETTCRFFRIRIEQEGPQPAAAETPAIGGGG